MTGKVGTHDHVVSPSTGKRQGRGGGRGQGGGVRLPPPRTKKMEGLG